jgi:hypothetical protein
MNKNKGPGVFYGCLLDFAYETSWFPWLPGKGLKRKLQPEAELEASPLAALPPLRRNRVPKATKALFLRPSQPGVAGCILRGDG